MHTNLAAVLLAIATGGCSAGSSSPFPAAALCYASGSIIWPLGIDTAPPTPVGSWLVLLPRPYSPHTARLAAFAGDSIGNHYKGSWARFGADSLEAQLWDIFTDAELRVAITPDALVGTARGSSDALMRDTSGVYVRSKFHWQVRFRRLPCAQVVDTLLRRLAAA